ncbi:MAG: DNA polymerase III subunit delta, partial [Chthoniobacterales bacterium]
SLDQIESTLQAILTFPFLGDGKLVWLKGATFLKDSPVGRSAAVQDALEKLLTILKEGFPHGTTLLISAPEPDKRRSFYKELSKMATVTLCDKPDFGFNATEHDLITWVMQRAKERDIKLDYEAAELLAARIGANSGQIEIELTKLATAIGEGQQITVGIIRDLVPLTRAGGIFDLSNAISKRDLPLSLDTLQQLRRQGESAIGILLAAIVPTMRNLLLAKDLMRRHRMKPPEKPFFFSTALQKLPESEVSHLPRKKDGTLNLYGLGLAASHTNRFEHSELVEGFLACCDVNERLLRSQDAEETLLTQLVIRLMARKS